jgi:tetratricopeptide (TPR) repeat protein
MATQTVAPLRGAARTPAGTSTEPLSDRLVAWVNAHRQLAYWIGTILVVGVVLFVWQLSTRRRSEEVASRELQGARFAFESQNLPLAASELARVIENYSGTNAAEQGRLLLANVRLLQGQPQQAVDLLGDYAPRAGRAYRSQAYGLLGAAFENLGRFRDAGETYENGAAAARLDFQRAQMLSDAGRAWTSAADTTRAVQVYQRIVKELPNEGAVTEAKVRLGELRKGTVS